MREHSDHGLIRCCSWCKILHVSLRVWEDLELLFDMQMSSYRELKDANMADACSPHFFASRNLGPGLPGGVDLAEEPLGRRDTGAPVEEYCVVATGFLVDILTSSDGCG